MTLEQNYPEWSGKPVAEALNDCHRYAIAVIVRTQGLRQSLLKEALTSISVQSNSCLAVVTVHAGAEMLERVESVCREIPSLSWVLIHADRVENKRGYPLNIGLQYACAFLNDAEAIAFLDDDDILYSNFSARMIHALSETDADVICAASNRSVQDQAVEVGYRPGSFMNLFIYNFIPINSYIIRMMSFAKKPIFFDETLNVVEDWHFLLQLLQNGFRFEAIADILSEFRVISDGNKQIKDNPDMWEQAHSSIHIYIRDSLFLMNGHMIHRLMTDESLKAAYHQKSLTAIQTRLDDHLHLFAEEIRQKNIHIADIGYHIEELKIKFIELQRQCEKQQKNLAMKEEHEIALNTQIHQMDMQLMEADRQSIFLVQVVAEKERFLREIFASKGWRWLTRYRNMKQCLVINRGNIVNSCVKRIFRVVSHDRKSSEGSVAFQSFLSHYCAIVLDRIQCSCYSKKLKKIFRIASTEFKSNFSRHL